MSATVSMVRDHHIILRGLEVLRLMGDRMESRHDVAYDDIQIVLGFMRDIAHPCLDNAEQVLRQAQQNDRLQALQPDHQEARTLFVQINGMAENAQPPLEFGPVSRLYASLMANLFAEHRFFPTLAESDDPARVECEKTARQLRELARIQGDALRNLEAKYTSPHCI
jgi:hemerythrin-like domain-containing protein